jgi:hypothetical protein
MLIYNEGDTMAQNIKRDRFIKIAEARTNKILDMLRLLGNCSEKSNYEYSEEDVRQIFSALERELKNTRNRFSGGSGSAERFALKKN